MKWTKILVPALTASLLLAACGSISTADGVSKMKGTLATLQKNVDAGDAGAVKKGADELEEAWEKIEDGVKKDHQDLYDKVENPLHAIEAGAKSSNLDKTALAKSIGDLSAALDAVEQAK